MALLYFWLYSELQGNRLFKEGKFELAKAKYEKVIESKSLTNTSISIRFIVSERWPKNQVLREFNHVNPQDDEEGKIFGDTRVSLIFSLRFL